MKKFFMSKQTIPRKFADSYVRVSFLRNKWNDLKDFSA